MTEIIANIQKALAEGKRKQMQEYVNQALDAGATSETILNDALIPAMAVVGEKFKNYEVFIPDVLMSARAMNAATAILKERLGNELAEPKGVAVIGTVKGDLHDIGKNLVRMMIEGRGVKVVDLGVDVPAEKFYEAAVAENADIVCCSALLTSTMDEMKNIIKVFEDNGIRQKVKIMIGGAPITQSFCDVIGADCYTEDAGSAADAALAFFE